MTPSSGLGFYTKDGCTLCDRALVFVERLARERGLPLRLVAIDEAGGDGDLWYRHRYRIPVIELDGEELAWGRIDEAEFRTALDAALAATKREPS